MLQTAPLLSSSAIPQLGKIGLSFFTAIVIFPWVEQMGYQIPSSLVDYFLLVLGEALLGVIMGFYLAVIYAAFQVAGQFFSLQMGFGASSVFDPLAQIELPLMGQFLNIVGMLVFIAIGGFQKFFLSGVLGSFKTISAINLVSGQGVLVDVFLVSLGTLFRDALTISFPILGTLFLVSTSMGLLAKAAPQMNLLMLGFPIAIGVAFLILFVSLPFLAEAFGSLVDNSFKQLSKIITALAESNL